MTIEPFITLPEMAALLRCSTDALRKQCQRQQIKCHKRLGQYLFTPAIYREVVKDSMVLDAASAGVQAIIDAHSCTPPLRYFQPNSTARGHRVTLRKNIKLARRNGAKHGR